MTPVSGGQPQSSGSPLADTVQSTVEQFVQQLRAVSGAGGSVAADPIVLSLYQTLNALHPQLLKQIDAIQQQKGELHVVYTQILPSREENGFIERSLSFLIVYTDSFLPSAQTICFGSWTCRVRSPALRNIT